MIRFLRYVCAYFQPNNSMATLSDLDNAIAQLTITANDVNTAAQTNLTAVQLAANRVSAIPTTPVDYQPQVDAVNAVNTQLAATKVLVDDAILAANAIAP